MARRIDPGRATRAAFLHHRLRLFFSVDLVGSTSLKQGREKESPGEQMAPLSWFRAIAMFYGVVPTVLARSWDASTRRLPEGWSAGAGPVFWKALGDEILYSQEITDYRQVAIALHAWRTAVSTARSLIRQEFPRLDLKAAAWVANFPGPNFELAFRVGSGDAGSGAALTERHNLECLNEIHRAGSAGRGLVLDFIGPSMDTGFRLAGLATPRKFVISVGLAWMVAESAVDPKLARRTGGWPIYFDGGVPLRDVLGRSPYPLFWIDLAHDSPRLRLEDGLLSRAPADPRKIAALCEAAVAEHEDYLFKPYIDPERYPRNRKFREVPPEHAERLVRLRKLWEGRARGE